MAYVEPVDFEFRGNSEGAGPRKGQAIQTGCEDEEDPRPRCSNRVADGQVETKRLPKYYPGRQWLHPFPTDSVHECTCETYNNIAWRTTMFTMVYSNCPAMFLNLAGMGAKCPFTLYDVDGDVLGGNNTYKLRLPPNIPAKLFWSVTLYDPMTGAGLDNGESFLRSIRRTSQLTIPMARLTSISVPNDLGQRLLRVGPPLRTDEGFLRSDMETR
jgi:hypothetical protein